MVEIAWYTKPGEIWRSMIEIDWRYDMVGTWEVMSHSHGDSGMGRVNINPG